ncbi:DUF808 domain-containing protein [Phaeovulum vinaykumarii]|uniref:DUF808 domain-containing protein n=1 Tax=Phaeovulum vinaykumarii TaxID=407234 RepID=A0A1N7MVG4_9RHOB|nr:DUF808 domain-containing protein [Phaeovulum vinaykumarii]SIS90125.1 hypothetical protein SAMN05421795_11071 [Phaeovulum vinaykumarii]SOC16762.1 hypothetical protein SAMN05878426_1115 [Phaeovulum vinaykumarii]
MSGLLALLDDVAGIAKIAAASVDDIAGQAVTSLDDMAGQAARAGTKTAGALIDDAAVTPKYVHGFAPARELPIVGKIALGSIRNKIVVLLPLALVLSAFAPWAVMPLLMLGGAYLCFEGAEKVWHLIRPAAAHAHAAAAATAGGDPLRLERAKVAGAVKTDFILSAEIMTISLAALPQGQPVWMQAGALALVAVGVTALVYGGVALIVKADDVGLWLAQRGRFRLTRGVGRGIVRVMPGFMTALMIVGTAAMIWVGGSILIHGLHELAHLPALHGLGLEAPAEWIAQAAAAAAAALPATLAQAGGTVAWIVTAFFDGIFGLAAGFVILPLALGVIAPLTRLFKRGG